MSFSELANQQTSLYIIQIDLMDFLTLQYTGMKDSIHRQLLVNNLEKIRCFRKQ